MPTHDVRAPLAWVLGLGLLAAPAAASASVSDPFPGVRLARNSQQSLAVVNLCAPGVSVRATRQPEWVRTASSFGQLVGAEVAINGDFYDIGGSNATWGRARGAGEDWPAHLQFRQGGAGEHRQYLAFGPGYVDLQMDSFVPPPPPNVATEIVGGHIMIIVSGKKVEPMGDILAPGLTPRPRTAVGLSQDRRTFFLFASSKGLDGNGIVSSMVALAAEAGAPPIWDATNLDGGGSTQMWVKGLGAVVPSSRQVANHWGIFAKGSGPAVNCPGFDYKATFVSQSFPYASQPPVVLEEGRTEEGFIELRNDGRATWKKGVVKLATAPRDTESPFRADDWLSGGRISTVTADVPPGGTFKFPLSLKGNEVGPAKSQFFGVVAEGITWFSDPGQGGPPDDLLEVRVEVVPAPPGEGGFGGEGAVSGAGGEGGLGPGVVGAGGFEGEGGAGFGNPGEAGGLPGDGGLHGSCACEAAGARGAKGAAALGLLALLAGALVRRRAGAS